MAQVGSIMLLRNIDKRQSVAVCTLSRRLQFILALERLILRRVPRKS